MAGKTVKTPKLMDDIIQQIMAGENIKSICQMPGMPDRRTVHRWLADDKEFNIAYVKAAYVRAQELINESLEIADREKPSHKDVAADRLRITTRLKVAAVLNPAFSGRAPLKPKPAHPEPIDSDKIDKVTVEIVKSPADDDSAQEPDEAALSVTS
jgi:hypothetical protein